MGAHHPHVFEIQNIVSGRVQTAHVARLRFFADSQLNVTADIKDVLQHAFNQGQFEMVGFVRVAEAEDRSLIVLVDWVGLEIEERTWEPFKNIFEAAPEFLKKELRKMTRAVAGHHPCHHLRRDFVTDLSRKVVSLDVFGGRVHVKQRTGLVRH